MESEGSEEDDDDRPQVIVYDDKSEPRRTGSRLARSEDSESDEEEEENSDAGIEYLEVRQKSGRKFLDNLRTLYGRRVQEALDLADQIR